MKKETKEERQKRLAEKEAKRVKPPTCKCGATRFKTERKVNGLRQLVACRKCGTERVCEKKSAKTAEVSNAIVNG
jgi:hypothetical protein